MDRRYGISRETFINNKNNDYVNDYVNDYNIMFHAYLLIEKIKLISGSINSIGSKGFRTQYSKCQMVIVSIFVIWNKLDKQAYQRLMNQYQQKEK